MPLGELLDEVLALQAIHTPDPKSAEMRRRKQLIEREIPEWIGSRIGGVFPDWSASGSNGKGAPAEVPWSRYFDPARSPAPTEGWYAVYLFDAAGKSVYLSLNQGTTTWDTGRQDFTFRSPEQLARRVGWARETLSTQSTEPLAFQEIDLKGRQRLGRVYQLGNVHGIEYRAGAIPSEEELQADLLRIGRLLAQLYEVESVTAYIPGDEAPEIVDAERVAAESAGNTRRRRRQGRGQGFGLTQLEKTIVEKCAVKQAIAYFESLGYKVKDTGNNESFDLLATKDSKTIYVEVKGTMSLGEQILLTRAEVEHHLAHSSDNALAVVHSIALDRTQQPPVASAGTLVVTQPWTIDTSELTVISYRYRIPAAEKG